MLHTARLPGLDISRFFFPLLSNSLLNAQPQPDALAAIMVDASVLRESLAQAAQSTRIVIRCLSSGRDTQESSQQVLSALVDILDLLYRINDQVSWSEKEWLVEAKRVNSLYELLEWFESTTKSVELYFQPGGVGVSYFRRHLLETSFLPRLEQYKIMLLLAMQPDSR